MNRQNLHFDDDIDRDSDDEELNQINPQNSSSVTGGYDTDVSLIMKAKRKASQISGPSVPPLPSNLPNIQTGQIPQRFAKAAIHTAVVLDKFRRYVTADDIYANTRGSSAAYSHQMNDNNDEYIRSSNTPAQTNNEEIVQLHSPK